MYKLLPCIVALTIFMASCASKKMQRTTTLPSIASDSIFNNAHVGLYVLDSKTGQPLLNYQSEKYFIPASNTKIITAYAAMKFLPDSMKGLSWIENDTAVLIFPAADPSFLHPDFKGQRVVEFFRSIKKPIYLVDYSADLKLYGPGWSWSDYSDDYMAERSVFPVYGNSIRWHQAVSKKENPTTPADTIDRFIYSDPDVNWPVEFTKPDAGGSFKVVRDYRKNAFLVTEGGNKELYKDIPFITEGLNTALTLLRDTIGVEFRRMGADSALLIRGEKTGNPINSVHTDSLLRLMMYRSDNFFAEQLLIATALQHTGKFNPELMISSLLNNELKDFPQKPSWVDGSGLSRFNMFTPQDFVWVLQKIKQEFGMARVQLLFPSAGSGTLRNYSALLKGHLFAKTGTLTGVHTLSGYLNTKSGRNLVFSFMLNNHRQPAVLIRQKLDALLVDLYNRY